MKNHPGWIFVLFVAMTLCAYGCGRDDDAREITGEEEAVREKLEELGDDLKDAAEEAEEKGRGAIKDLQREE